MSTNPDDGLGHKFACGGENPLLGQSLQRGGLPSVVVAGCSPSPELLERLKALFARPDMVELVSVLSGDTPCTVAVETKPALREPLASFEKAGEFSVALPSRLRESEANLGNLEKAVLAAGFLALGLRVAQDAVRAGRVSQEHEELLRRLASAHNSGGVQEASRSAVRDLLAAILKEPQKPKGKNTKSNRNFHREQVEQRAKRSWARLGERLDCSTPERAALAVSVTMERVAGAKAATELLGDPKGCDKVIAGAVQRLRSELREQFARSLAVVNHTHCQGLLDAYKELHLEIARGGYHRPLPSSLHAPARVAPLSLRAIGRELFSEDLFGGARERGGLQGLPGARNVDSEIPQAAMLAAEIKQFAEMLAFSQEQQLERERSQFDFVDYVDAFLSLTPGLARSLQAIGRRDASADPTILEQLLLSVFEMRFNTKDGGVWMHDLILSGLDIPRPNERNPDVRAHARAASYADAVKLLVAWRDVSAEGRAQLIEQHREFLNLFVVSTARAAIYVYENQCAIALEGGNDDFIQGASIVFDDLAAIEANFPYILQMIPEHFSRAAVEQTLLEASTGLREGMKRLAQMTLSDDELLSEARDLIRPAVSGPLRRVLDKANQQLRERLKEHVQGLTEDAEQQLESLFLQDSARGLLEHSRKLLAAVILEPSKREHQLLATMIERKIRGYVGVIDALYTHEKLRIESVQEKSGGVLAPKDVESSLQSVYLMVSELREIRDGVRPYQDLLVPPPPGDTSSSVISNAPITELASLHIDLIISGLKRLLKSQPEVVRSVHQYLRRQTSSEGDEAWQALEGLSMLRLPRAMLSHRDGESEAAG